MVSIDERSKINHRRTSKGRPKNPSISLDLLGFDGERKRTPDNLLSRNEMGGEGKAMPDHQARTHRFL